MKGWACTTECKGRHIDVGSSCFVRCRARWRRRDLPRREWLAEQCVPLQGRESNKEREKRISPSRGLGGVLCPSTPPLPPALRPMRRITASPLSECRGISNGFFGQALTFAARSMQHTVNQLQQWAKEPDLGVKSFACSILSTSQSICLPYHGMVLNRTSNFREGFVFCAESCSRICSGQCFDSGLRCSFCDLQKKRGSEKKRQSIKPSTGCVGKRATIQKQ